MIPEFKDITVRVQQGDIENFYKSLEMFPEAVVLGENEYVPHPLLVEWEEELDQVQSKVGQVKAATERLDGVCLRGYVQLWKELERFARFRNLGLTMEEFVQNSLGIFSSSVDEHKRWGPTPSYGTSPRKKYSIIGGFLNPREIRLIIGKFGLTGERMSDQEIKASEDISNVSNTVHFVARRLVLCLEDKVNPRTLAN